MTNLTLPIFFVHCESKRSILEQQIKTKRHQAPHIRASDLQIMRSDGSRDGILAYNGNDIQLFNSSSLFPFSFED